MKADPEVTEASLKPSMQEYSQTTQKGKEQKQTAYQHQINQNVKTEAKIEYPKQYRNIDNLETHLFKLGDFANQTSGKK